jgi:hypothetical protein
VAETAPLEDEYLAPAADFEPRASDRSGSERRGQYFTKIFSADDFLGRSMQRDLLSAPRSITLQHL